MNITEDKMLEYLSKALVVVAVLVIGYVISRLILALLRKILDRSRMDGTAEGFVLSVLKVIFYFIVAVTALGTIGVNVASLITALGAAALTAGLALQDLLKNVVSGLVILINKPFVSGNILDFEGVKGTVEENLKMGNPNATEEEMWASLEHVDLAEYLRENLGLKTKVLEKASNLSGGQRQRLALARALLHDTSVYIFDEATSNIDVESENRIMEVIRELAKRKTVVMISHRLANVVDSDTIYVMEKGCIVQSGTHTELLQASGVYRRLYESQQKLEQYGMEEIQGREGERKVCVEAV